MKIITNTISATPLLLLPTLTYAQRRTQTEGTVHVKGACDYNSVLAAYDAAFAGSGASELAAQLGNPADVPAAVATKCAGASGPGSAVAFSTVSNKGIQHDRNYYSGGTSWNDGGEQPLNVDAGRVARIAASTSTTRPIEWPDTEALPMFDGCDLRAVTCCFTGKRDNVKGPSVSGGDPEANAEICSIDLSLNYMTNHVLKGYSVYERKETDAAYCSGFAWSNDANDVSNKFKANTLFEISMNDALMGKNYVKNAPGAPMCGCAEKMPTVTTAACTEAVEGYAFTYADNELSVSYAVAFEACSAGDLMAHYEANVGDATEIDALKDYIVGDDSGKCQKAQDDFIFDNFALVKGGTPPPGSNVDLDKWEPVVGKGALTYPDVGAAKFRELLDASPNKIVRRICKSCYRAYQDVYYKRHTAVPADMDLLEYLKSEWKSENNLMGTDFDLFSTYDQALSQEEYHKWRYCNYDYSKVGFPRDCGKYGYSGCNWNSFTRSGCYAYDVAFFVEKATE